MSSQSITDLYLAVAQRQTAIAAAKAILGHGQEEALIQLQLQKKQRESGLRERFAGKRIERLVLSRVLNKAGIQLPGCTVEYLERDYFRSAYPETPAGKRARLQDAVVVVNNNDLAQRDAWASYASLYRDCGAIFAAWDFDNHHWLELSTFLAAHSDLYAPAHYDNLYLLSRYNWALTGPVHCAVIQWPAAFVAAHLPRIIAAERSNDPLGVHLRYEAFSGRNRAISGLQQQYPSIRFSTSPYSRRSPKDRLREWCSHKAHWVVPVLNDVPNRLFDAWATGGIPIVPESIRYLPPLRDIDPAHIVFYGPSDLTNPKDVVDEANALFDRGGRDRLVERHRLALEHHHAGTRIRQILASVAQHFGMRLPG